MTRDNSIKLPFINPSHRLRKRLPIRRRQDIPGKPLMPRRRRRQQRRNHLRQRPRIGRLVRPRILLARGEVENQIGLDHRPRRLMQED